MDTTKKYIEMCEEAFKDIGYVQPTCGLPNLMIPEPGAIKYQRPKDLILAYAKKFEEIRITMNLPKPIGQVYRQDQLQNIVYRTESCSGKLSRLQCFYANEYFDKGKDCYSFQELFLAFVMKEKYNKTWNGKEWIKEEK